MTFNDEMNVSENPVLEGIPNGLETIPTMERPQPQVDLSGLFDKLKTQTGDGEIEDYMSHPLNQSGSRATAQILRGVSGFVGQMRYALLDIVMGFINLKRERMTPYDNTLVNQPKGYTSPIGGGFND